MLKTLLRALRTFPQLDSRPWGLNVLETEHPPMQTPMGTGLQSVSVGFRNRILTEASLGCLLCPHVHQSTCAVPIILPKTREVQQQTSLSPSQVSFRPTGALLARPGSGCSLCHVSLILWVSFCQRRRQKASGNTHASESFCSEWLSVSSPQVPSVRAQSQGADDRSSSHSEA